jgi:flagellar hook-length control protein FliK
MAAASNSPAAAKTDAPDGASEDGPGAQRAADNATATPASNTPDASKAGGQAQASPSAAAVQPANAQANTKTQADTPAADIKIDAAAATSTSTSTPTADALTGRTQTADAPKANPALATASPTVVQVYTRMVERMDGRAQRFEIRLDPAELGRVDIRIEVGADHKVHAVLAAHDSAALSDLMRGQRTLERALQDAGIDLADGGLQFEMSQDRGLTGNEQRESWGQREQTNVWRGFDTVDVGVDADARDLVQATRSYRRAAARLDLVA